MPKIFKIQRAVDKALELVESRAPEEEDWLDFQYYAADCIGSYGVAAGSDSPLLR